jgi:hypothetical protein
VPRTPAMPAWRWVFTEVSREPLAIHRLDDDRVGLDILPGVAVRVWPLEDYTAYAVAGEEGLLPSTRTGQANSERIAQLTGIADMMNEIPTDAILDTSTASNDPEEHPGREDQA